VVSLVANLEKVNQGNLEFLVMKEVLKKANLVMEED